MFEQELYNKIKADFSLEEYNIGFGFGEIAESQKAPYIIMFPLNSNGTRQVLCDDDDYTDGETSIQFSIYAKNYKNALYIGQRLDVFLASLKLLPNYRILLNNSEVQRGFENINTALSMHTVSRLFTYHKIGVN